MKTLPFFTLSFLAGALTATAQFNFDFAFNSGSTGSDGPLIVTNDFTTNLPPSGIFNFTTINVAAGATLRFSRNAANTPVYLLAQGNVTIAGTIDVSGETAPGGSSRVGGKGGPGGFDGGFPAFNQQPPGDGYGPGGGKAGDFWRSGNCWGFAESAGYGAYATLATVHYQSTNKGAVYGSPLLVPLLGGSGGGGTFGSPGYGGGGGGGAILIASSTSIQVSGIIRANGGRGQTNFNPNSCNPSGADINPGSGGAIRLVAPVVAGSGTLRALGPSCCGGVDASHGRIRIDSIDKRNIPTDFSPGAYVGTYMVTFPPSRLDIVKVGDTNIAVGSGPVAIQLETNSDTNRAVVVQASNFNASVSCVLALTPENGPRRLYTNVVNNLGTNAVTPSTFNVGLPVNTIVTISAWTQ